MNKLNATLSEVFDIEPIGSTELLPATPVTKVDDDADFARDNIRTLIEKGNLAVDGILHVQKSLSIQGHMKLQPI
jgi:predicted transglutaminase-like cysteine proteinase